MDWSKDTFVDRFVGKLVIRVEAGAAFGLPRQNKGKGWVEKI